MSDKIRVGIVGSGGRSSAHAKAYLDFGAEIVAFCDIVEEKARARSEEFGAKEIYTDYRKLIENKSVDAISICATTGTHAEIAISALETGIHVLCEKPMAQSLRQCDDMIAAAERNGVKLAVNFQSRFYPRTHWIKELIEMGKMGDVVIAKGYGWTIHVWDLVQYVMGEPVRIMAEWGGDKALYGTSPLLATVCFANGHVGFMQASNAFHEPFLAEKRNCVGFVGSKLTAFFGLWANELILSSHDAEYLKEIEAVKAKAFTDKPIIAPGVPDIADFLTAIIEDREPTIPGREGRKSIEFVVATYKSALTGKPVSPPILPSDEAYSSTERRISG